MNKNNDLKEKLLYQIQDILDKRIETATLDIELAKESRDNETKSSVGDKYETGRTMVQFELEKLTHLLNKNILLKNELSKLELKKKFDTVEFGSLVFTNSNNYFISIGIGKIELKNNSFYCISASSPIGKLLLHKKPTNNIFFQEENISILKIE